MRKIAVIGLATALIATLAASGAVLSSGGDSRSDGATVQSDVKIAERDLNNISDALMRRGYYDIEIVEAMPPYFEVEACRNDRLFAMTVDKQGNIKQSEDVARCTDSGIAGAPGPRQEDGRDNVIVDAPGAKVSTGDKGTHVKTPFADVKVDKDGGVHIRAPFVDLKVPRKAP